jgi:hypothetical protein
VVDRGADAHAVMAQAFLAQSLVSFTDALSILDACPTTLALDRVRPNWREHGEAAGGSLQARLKRRELHGQSIPPCEIP